MTKYLLILILLLPMMASIGQALDGHTYLDDRDTLIFYNDSVSLSIMSNGGLIYPIEGVGQYCILEHYLIVETGADMNNTFAAKRPIELGDTRFLDNETAIFKINHHSSNFLKLVLLGICDNEDYKGRKTIKRFERDHKKLKYRKRKLKKVTLNSLE